ncbi:HAD family hydrolase [Paenibacillus sp. CAU 1782]
MKKAVFLDVDDTLYDHLLPFRKAVGKWLPDSENFPYAEAYYHFRYFSDKLSHELGGAGAMGDGEVVESMRSRRFVLTLAEYGITLTDSEGAEAQRLYMGCQYDIEMFPGARELLLELRNAGYVTGLITNGEGSHQRKKITAMELEGLVEPDYIFISGEQGWDKPDTRLFQYVNDQTGTSPENCVYIGDSWRNDVVGALDAGWRAIWFNHRMAKPESEHQPHCEITDFSDLKSAIASQIGGVAAL